MCFEIKLIGGCYTSMRELIHSKYTLDLREFAMYISAYKALCPRALYIENRRATHSVPSSLLARASQTTSQLIKSLLVKLSLVICSSRRTRARAYILSQYSSLSLYVRLQQLPLSLVTLGL